VPKRPAEGLDHVLQTRTLLTTAVRQCAPVAGLTDICSCRTLIGPPLVPHGPRVSLSQMQVMPPVLAFPPSHGVSTRAHKSTHLGAQASEAGAVQLWAQVNLTPVPWVPLATRLLLLTPIKHPFRNAITANSKAERACALERTTKAPKGQHHRCYVLLEAIVYCSSCRDA
jgi:hypothetical protein